MHARATRSARRDEPRPDAGRRPPAPHDLTALHRAAGNHAVARLLARAPLQRKPVTAQAYLNGIIATGPADPEWDPQWTTALKRVLATDGFAGLFPAMDDASESDAGQMVARIKGLAQLSNETPNLYRVAMDAVRWHAGIESDSSSSGFGSLDTANQPITGRPAFPTLTQQNIPVKAGQHRRHVLAWHTIREFVSIAYGARRAPVVEEIWKAVHAPPDPAVEQAVAEAFKHVVSGREKTHAASGELSDAELLKIGLFVMNGNPRNLWAGKGTINSAINTAQMTMNKDLDGVATFKGLSDVAIRWQAAKGKAVYATATDLGADTLTVEATRAYEAWAMGGAQQAQEATAVNGVIAKVSQYVLSNLELDVLGETKAMTEIANEKASSLADARAVFDHVVQGVVDIRQLDEVFIRNAITEFMKYV
jgi:hypothetical protein